VHKNEGIDFKESFGEKKWQEKIITEIIRQE
jgi:hypothetical protein